MKIKGGNLRAEQSPLKIKGRKKAIKGGKKVVLRQSMPSVLLLSARHALLANAHS